MGITISDSEKPLTAEDLKRTENRINIDFPAQYRNFLLKHNGGHPEPSVFKFKCEGQEAEIAAVAYFLAIYDGKEENFLDYLKTYEDRIPSGLMPIARDPGGNVILIGTKDAHLGKIYFWQQDFEPETPDFSNICSIADSFDEFFNSLFDPDA